MTDLQRHVLMQTRNEMLAEARRGDTPEFQAKQLFRLARNIHEVLTASRRRAKLARS
jgi:hypothetical protein